MLGIYALKRLSYHDVTDGSGRVKEGWGSSRELEALIALRGNQNIVQLKAVCSATGNSHKCCMFELLDETIFSFRKRLFKQEPMQLQREPNHARCVRNIAKGVLSALVAVNSAGYAFVDLHTANVMISQSGIPKLIDFSRVRCQSESRIWSSKNTSTTLSNDSVKFVIFLVELITGKRLKAVPDVFPAMVERLKLLRQSIPKRLPVIPNADIDLCGEFAALINLMSQSGTKPSLCDIQMHFDQPKALRDYSTRFRPKEWTFSSSTIQLVLKKKRRREQASRR